MAQVGRPSKYNAETIPKTRRYIEQYQELGDAIPSIAGLAVELGVARETIHVWSHEEGKEDFSNMLQELLATQERVLMSKGLTSEFNSNITKLVLGKHGYHDKQEHTGVDGKDLIPTSRPDEIARDIAFLLAQGLKDASDKIDE